MYHSPHSPFGTLYEIAACQAFTLRDILYRMPWQTVMIMMLDRGKTVKKKAGTEELTRQEDVDAFLQNTKGYRKN
jgi:hypothetical protein